jgi:cell wall-associated NlpC family hydrolase
VYKTDCSGLVNYVLKKAVPVHLLQIPNSGRPRAEDYYNFFVSLPQGLDCMPGTWCRVKALEHARKGDIIVYKFTGAKRRKKGATGHVMIVLSEPRKIGHGDYVMIVADSANSPHGDDSRKGCRKKCGVGRGKMWFGVDKNGRPTSYRWNDAQGTPQQSGIRGIVIGRAL